MSWARSEVEAWVCASLVLQRGAAPTSELLTTVRPWLDATLDVVAVLPPIGVIADLGRLLARAPFDIARSEDASDPALREALDAYEEHVLGRLSADFRLEAARDALVRLDVHLRPAAIAVFVEQVLARIHRVGDDELDTPGPAAVRRVLHRHGVELLETGAEALSDPDLAELRLELAGSYASLAKAARGCGALIGDVELYTLENHEALHIPSLRLAMAQIAEAGQLIERHLPTRVRRSEASRGRTPTRIEDESAYPIGGYASISTVGGIESLVSSELIYMSPAEERAGGGVDLFDLRWAGGELLKYTRDESVHTRERRTVCFALAPELDGARIKDPEVPFQRLVVSLGGLVVGVRKLCAWLDEAELHLHVLPIASPAEPGRPRAQPLGAEIELVRLLLREHIESRVVEIVEIDDPGRAREHAEEAAELGGSDLVWLLGEPWRAPEPSPAGERREPSRVREHALSLGEGEPRVWIDSGSGTEERALRATGWEAWLRGFGELLQALV